jgi:Condensation domain
MLFFERLMYVDGRTPVNCVIAARVQGTVSQQNIRLALDKVQTRHRLLGATVIELDGIPAFTFTEDVPKIPIRIVERTKEDDWNAEVSREWKTPFRMERDPLMRLVWIRSEPVSELLLVGHHCLCDGASLVTIFRELLQVMDQPSLALKPYRPFQSLQELLPEEVFKDRKLALMAAAKAGLFRLFSLTIKPAVSVPGGEHYQICWKAASDTSAALSQRSKSEGTTPFAAMSVAFLLAFRMCRGVRFKNKMMCPVNIRRYMPNIETDVLFNYAPTVALALDRDSNMDFWTLAKMLKRSMSRRVESLNAYEHLMAAEHLHAAVGKLIQLLMQSEGSYDFAFSNVGPLTIKQTYSTFQLDRFLGITVALPWRNATTLVSTSFQGEIDLTFVSRSDVMPHAEALGIKDQAVEILTRALA